MGLVLSLLAAAATILGLVTLFKPIPQLKLTTRGRSLALLAIGLVALMVVGRPPLRDGGASGPGGPGGQPQLAGNPQAGGAGGRRGPQKQVRQDMPMLPTAMPARQLRFLASVEEARTAAQAAGTPAAQTAIQSQRRDALCELLQDVAVTNWVGRVHALQADTEGRGIVTVKLTNDVVLTTAISPRNETEADTLVPRKSPLYADVSRYKTGDMVVISGEFLSSPETCVADIGSLTEPAFVFKFSALTRYF